jgi:hypothetical protein
VPVPLVVTGSQSYGAASPTLAASSTLPSGVGLSGTVSCAKVADTLRTGALDATTPAGRWLVHGPSCSGLTLTGPTASNYQISYYSGRFAVDKVPLTVTAADVIRPYGLANPPLTYTLAGFVNHEDASVITGQPVLSTTVTSTTAPGVYPITVNTSAMQAANYSISSVPASFTVVRAIPVISAPTMRVRTAMSAHRVQYTATLHNTALTGPPIAGVPVTFAVRAGLARVTCNAVTNELGVASCTSSNVAALMFATPRSYTVTVPPNLQNFTGATASRPIVY